MKKRLDTTAIVHTARMNENTINTHLFRARTKIKKKEKNGGCIYE